MPIEATPAFDQLAVGRDRMPWLRCGAASTPKLGQLIEYRIWSIHDVPQAPKSRPTRTFSDAWVEQLESRAVVERPHLMDREHITQTNVRRLLGKPPYGRLPAAEEVKRTRENLPYLVVRDLIEREKIGAARKLLAAIPLEYLSDPLVLRLLKMLAQPKVKIREKQDIDRQKDYDWLRDHAQEYTGRWVALHNGQLLAAAATLRDISEKLKVLRLSRPPLLHRIK